MKDATYRHVNQMQHLGYRALWLLANSNANKNLIKTGYQHSSLVNKIRLEGKKETKAQK
jgi:hypothetical protein